MGRIKGIDELKLTFDAMEVVRRLTSLPRFNEVFAELLPGIASAKVEKSLLVDAPLRQLLSDYQVPSVFFSAEVSDGVSIVLLQFLVLDYYYRRDCPDVNTIAEAWLYIRNNEELRKTFVHFLDRSLLIVYLEHFADKSWNELALTLDGDWSSIALLDESLPYCRVTLEAMFHFITVSSDKNPNDLGIGMLGNNLLLKLQMESALKEELRTRLDEVLEISTLRGMLPMFLRALVGENAGSFAQLVNELPPRYAGTFSGDLYYALGAACPHNTKSLAIFKNAIDEAFRNGSFPRMLYLKAAGVKNFLSSDIVAVATDISGSPANEEELAQVLQFLIIHVDAFTETWFRDIAARLVVRLKDQKHQQLEHFFYLLKDKDPRLIYELFSARFAALGKSGVLEGGWHDLVREDPELFAQYITHWLKDGNAATHWALLFLCSIQEVPVSCFRVSPQALKGSSTSERLYIAYKVAGYIYSCDHLQQLLFSIMETVRPEEEALYQNLYNLFYNYVIYNYRGTLEQIDQLLKKGKLPAHLEDFYRSLQKDYNYYFADLDRVRAFKELRPHSRLSEYIQFYRQDKFSASFNKMGKSSFHSLFKNTPVHSHRWAILRPKQAVHKVEPLGHVQSSFEFPSGEKLNPAFQDMTRRTYQKITKDEIDIG